MYHNRFVSSPPLSHAHLVDDMNKGLSIGAQTLGTPLIHLKLSHLLNLTGLKIIIKEKYARLKYV